MSTNTLSIIKRLEDAIDDIILLDDDDPSSIYRVVRQIIDDFDNQASLEEADRDALLAAIDYWERSGHGVLSELRIELQGKIAPQQPVSEAKTSKKRKETSADPPPAKRKKLPANLSATGPDFGAFVAKKSLESAVEKQTQADNFNVATAVDRDISREMLISLAQITLQAHIKIREEDTRQLQLRIDAGQVKHLPAGTKLRDLEKIPLAMKRRNLARRRKANNEDNGDGEEERGNSKRKSMGRASGKASGKAKAKGQEGDALGDTPIAEVTKSQAPIEEPATDGEQIDTERIDISESESPSNVQPADDSHLNKYGLGASDDEANYAKWLLEHAESMSGKSFTYKARFKTKFGNKALSSVAKLPWLLEVLEDCNEKVKAKATAQARQKTSVTSRRLTRARAKASKQAETDNSPEQPLIRATPDEAVEDDNVEE